MVGCSACRRAGRRGLVNRSRDTTATTRDTGAIRAHMSELFDLLNFGTPASRHGGLSNSQPKSPTPSPRGRVAWEDSQPSSSPQELLAGSALPTRAADASVKENAPPPPTPQPAAPITSPSQRRSARLRRRARPSARGTYTYQMFTCAPGATLLSARTPAAPHGTPTRDESQLHPRRAEPRDRLRPHARDADAVTSPPVKRARPLGRVQSEPAVSPSQRHPRPAAASADDLHTHASAQDDAHGSDDSFSRLLDEDFPIDTTAMEELAELQGW